MKKHLQQIEQLLGIFRWHPKIALRYLPIVEEINTYGSNNSSILEVGSGSLGIAPYIKREVTGVDINFSGPKFSLLKQKKGNALSLSFKDRSFDFVVSVDLLEHLPKKLRFKAISEAIRVARRECIIAVPAGVQSASQDKEIGQHYQVSFGRKFPYCSEHVQYGLPEQEEIRTSIQKVCALYKRSVFVRSQGNINLQLRFFLMKGWMTTNPIVDFSFRKVMLLFIPFFRLLNQEPTYRTIFFIRFNDE